MLHVHRATSAAPLVARLAQILGTPPDDPFQPEVVAVHSRGIERWVAQRLAHHLGTGTAGATADDGVAANIEFPFPGTIVHRALVGATGGDARDDADRWDPDRLAFTLLDLWERGDLGEVDLGGFGVHVATGRHRRLPAFRHAAELFDGYQQHRPELVRAWAAWDGEGGAPDGRGGTVPPHLGWQPRLLRAVRDVVGPTRAETTATAAARLRAGSGPVPGLPDRLSLFALTALAAAHFEVLAALTERVDVHAFLLHPSPAAWERDRPVAAAVGPGLPRPTRSATPLARDGHPLMTAWGRDSRELQVLLGDAGRDELLEPATTAEPTTLLARLQQDVAADRELPAADRWVLDPDDDSLQVHAAHGLHRQVEVARDAVLAALAADPTLEPRDIVVMTPDVERFAPLVTASFRAAATAASGIPDVRLRLADRSLLVVNPVLVALGRLLDMVEERFEAGRVLDFLRHGPVLAAAGLDDDDLEVLTAQVDRANVKWGLDGDHRRDRGLATAVNTWEAGLDRLLAGVVAPDVARVGEVVPLDAPVDPALLGALAEFVARLRHVRSTVLADGGEHSVARWRALLEDAADLVLGDGTGDGTSHGAVPWQRWQLDAVLAELAELARDGVAPLTLREVRGLLASRLGGRPSRANHQTGDLTVCSLVPMRTVPFRMVVVVGLDDGSWPRQRTRAGDDLLGLVPVVGDRDPASEDRQLLLDALMAAGDRLVLTYRGAHQSTNQPVPPSVVVSELLDVVDDTATVADVGLALADPAAPRRPRDLVVERHPLRAADIRTFRSERPHFDRLAAAAATAAQSEPEPVMPLAHAPPLAAPTPPHAMTLDELVRVLANPARAYMRHVLGFADRDLDDARDDNLAVDATGLDGWGLGDVLLRALVAGDPVDTAVARLRAAGDLPVGRLAEPAIDALLPTVRSIAAVYHDAVASAPAVAHEPVPVDLLLGGVRLRGLVRPTAAGRLVRVTYSRHKPKTILAGWIRILAATASGISLELVDIAKTRSGKQDVLATSHVLTPPDRDTAKVLLTDLVATATWVLTNPTPLFGDTSGTYWQEVLAGKDDSGALRIAAKTHWSTGWPATYGEGHDPNVVRIFGGGALDVLTGDLPQAPLDDAPPWWDDDGLPHDLARWARRVYDPVWQASEVREHGPVEDLP